MRWAGMGQAFGLKMSFLVKLSVIGWLPRLGADFKWTFSGGVASLNHRLQYVMPLASLHPPYSNPNPLGFGLGYGMAFQDNDL